MVPGMTERECLIADVRRTAWLADALTGPARIPRGLSQRQPTLGDGSLPSLLQRRRSYPSVRELRQLARMVRWKSNWPFARRATAK